MRESLPSGYQASAAEERGEPCWAKERRRAAWADLLAARARERGEERGLAQKKGEELGSACGLGWEREENLSLLARLGREGRGV